MEREIWKELPIISDNDDYIISSYGKIFNTRENRLLNCRINSSGYREITLKINGEEKSFRIHRLVALAFIPNPENKPHINHIDAVRTNNCVSNLEWCTQRENALHAVKIGNVKIPSRGAWKVTKEIIAGVILEHKNLTQKEIGNKFGISQSKVSKIFESCGLRGNIKPPISKEIITIIENYLLAGIKAHDVAHLAGVDVDCVRRRKYKLKKRLGLNIKYGAAL